MSMAPGLARRGKEKGEVRTILQGWMQVCSVSDLRSEPVALSPPQLEGLEPHDTWTALQCSSTNS